MVDKTDLKTRRLVLQVNTLITNYRLFSVQQLAHITVTMSTFQQVETKHSGEGKSITISEAANLINLFLSGNDEICPVMLMALVVLGLLWLTQLFNVTWRTGTTPTNQKGSDYF